MAMHKASASSPFAPTGRNTFLVRLNNQNQRHGHRRIAQVAVLVLVARYWKRLPQLLELAKSSAAVRRVLQWLSDSRILLLLSSCPNVCRLALFQVRMKLKGFHRSLLSRSAVRVDHLRNIKSVLRYWFGQYTPDVAQKKLWMISSSSTTWRETVDAEIAERFVSIARDLFNNKVWREWVSPVYGYEGKLAVIIVLDQFSRHIRRVSSEAMHPQEELDSVAYRVAKLFCSQHEDAIRNGMIPVPMCIFALMPYRHQKTIDTQQFVQKSIDDMASREHQMESMIGRFRKATNRRMALLQDERRRTGSASAEQGAMATATKTAEEDILEVFPFEADMGPAMEHTVCKTIVSFLQERGIRPHKSSNSSSNNKDDDDNSTDCPVIVSLSGGVDSMVIASVLSYLRKDHAYRISITAIHIDYANRPESVLEARYVEKYCKELGISFVCRRIDEITRGVTARDDYEREARSIRYGTYREVVQRACDSGNQNPVGVMLGHHKGDLRENVLSNAHKGCGPLDLSGMTSVSRNDGVTVFRPLLPLEKTEIFDFAHKFGVPYFKDTTPHWSTRGKLRNKLLPLLQEVYGDGCMENLSSLAKESDDARGLLFETVLNPFLNQIERTAMGIMFHTTTWKDQPLLFWKLVLREALHSASLGMFSDKSVKSFLERVQVETVKSGWLQCKRDYAVYLREDGKVFVLNPQCFPFRKSDQFSCVGEVVEAGQIPHVVGPWQIRVEVVANVNDENPVFSTLEEFMRGNLQYDVRVPGDPSAPRPLMFHADFTKASRPAAWKGIDLKIQSVLPLLGNDDEGTKMLSKGCASTVVRVNMSLATDRQTNSC